MSKSFLGDIQKLTKNKYAAPASEGIQAGDITGYIDTGSYALNALVSGDIFKGFPENKISTLAGEKATGKTFFLLGLVKNFLDINPMAEVMYFESESAISKDMMVSRGIDVNRVYVIPVATIEDF